MANIQSQKKRNRQNEAARQRNRAMSSELKTRSRNAIEVAENGDAAAAEEALRAAQKRIDMAATKGLLAPVLESGVSYVNALALAGEHVLANRFYRE